MQREHKGYGEQMMERKRRPPYHEAGHAVVAWALALPITSICIADSKSRHRIRKAGHLTAMEQVALCYAGLAGGALSGDIGEEGEGARDVQRGERILRSVAYSRGDPVLRHRLRCGARLMADEIVHEFADVVVLLAVRLMLGDLTQFELVELLDSELDDNPAGPTVH